MHIADLRRVEKTNFICDVCIVGGGPAGLTIASELANTSLSIVVLESGGKSSEEPFATNLNEIENVGAPREMKQQKVRNRVLGGSSHTWFGRCTSLDSIDYEARPWVPSSGWPITPEELAPYLVRARSHLGLGEDLYQGGLPTPSRLAANLQSEEGTELRTVAWQFSSRSALHNDYVRFGPQARTLRANNISVFTHAIMTELESNSSESYVKRLKVVTPSGNSHWVEANYVVLCGGGIENARMLLASNGLNSAGLGNRHGMVGRYFMDHPRTRVGRFAPESAPLVQRELGLFRAASGARVQCGLSLSFDVQRREELLNCAAWTTQHIAEDDAWRSLRTVSLGNGGSRLAAAKVMFRNVDQIAVGLTRKFLFGQGLTRRLHHLDLDVMVEQAPNPESRIRLSRRRDAMNVPLSEIDWRISELEGRTVIRLAHAVNDALRRSGLPAATLSSWVLERSPADAIFIDPAHPLGATRMASRPEEGVVDRNGKVFGIENLYIAGSSTFPTGGHANPTLTIVALSVRLADRLREIAIQRKSLRNASMDVVAVAT